jgi:hypothetical protein
MMGALSHNCKAQALRKQKLNAHTLRDFVGRHMNWATTLTDCFKHQTSEIYEIFNAGY